MINPLGALQPLPKFEPTPLDVTMVRRYFCTMESLELIEGIKAEQAQTTPQERGRARPRNGDFGPALSRDAADPPALREVTARPKGGRNGRNGLSAERPHGTRVVVLHRNSANSQAVSHTPHLRWKFGLSDIPAMLGGLSVWRYSQPGADAAPFQETPVEAEAALEALPTTAAVEAEVDSAEDSGDSPSSSEIPSDWPCGEVLTPVDFGAKGDGHHDDSSAVWAAIAHGIRCNSTVLLGPRRHRFLVMPNVLEVTAENLIIVFEAQLVGPTLEAWNPTLESWPKGSCAYAEAHCQRSGGQSPEFARSQWSLLFLRNCRNMTLVGRSEGTHLEGGLLAPGNSFWRVRNTKPQVRGYCLLKLDSCEDMRISKLQLHDSPMYQVVVARSHEVELNGLRITLSNQALGDSGAHNTDGVNILNSSRVTLRRSVIESGDDNVVVKEGSSDIFAESLQLRRGKGVSIGSLGEREAEGQEVTNVLFRDISSDHCVHGVRIKTWKGARGLVQNATFERFRVADVMVGWYSHRPNLLSSFTVRFRDFSGTFQQMDRKASALLCVRLLGLGSDWDLSKSWCDDVTYENIALRPAGPAIPQRVLSWHVSSPESPCAIFTTDRGGELETPL
ncbi:unnamed protein product [Cladocopium goreaui]|uniref:Probable polygalacturonase At3g15720 (PG) (Pectinase At3g15720) n=1 Tax=Cladocopium goreaui TaxID=2562237 RepID=A0A9P1D2V4_9DINO|nr:unnamed protein product [Cladocopium goreaui]